MQIFRLSILVLLILQIACKSQKEDQVSSCKCDFANSNLPSDSMVKPIYAGIRGALLASRFQSLEELKAVVQIEYFNGTTQSDSGDLANSMVRLTHCSAGQKVVSVLKSGVSQDDLADAKKGSLGDRIGLGLAFPFVIPKRVDLQRINILARRMRKIFEVGDVAFYDLAEASVNKINTDDLAYQHAKDSSEKGYINTFNHITAQTLISSCFSEKMADFIADLHERHNMPELTSGKFTQDQLHDLKNGPVDNYVDMINNEWGQELGKRLKEKFHISRQTHWTAKLLANYLNEIQAYYRWSFQIGMKPFIAEDEIVIRFSHKLNVVMAEGFL